MKLRCPALFWEAQALQKNSPPPGLAIVWGVHAVVSEDARDERDMTDRACRHAYIDGFVGVGERVIVVAGVPFGTPGSTNNLRIAVVGPDGGAG